MAQALKSQIEKWIPQSMNIVFTSILFPIILLKEFFLVKKALAPLSQLELVVQFQIQENHKLLLCFLIPIYLILMEIFLVMACKKKNHLGKKMKLFFRIAPWSVITLLLISSKRYLYIEDKYLMEELIMGGIGSFIFIYLIHEIFLVFFELSNNPLKELGFNLQCFKFWYKKMKTNLFQLMEFSQIFLRKQVYLTIYSLSKLNNFHPLTMLVASSVLLAFP